MEFCLTGFCDGGYVWIPYCSFTKNGVLAMLERDMATKKAPERWQNLTNEQIEAMDVVICLDYRIFLVVLDGMFCFSMSKS